ncbi:MAG TPA: aminotransferase class V-fold PLP-dependent enzyme [Rubricoccaceae bacterium]
MTLADYRDLFDLPPDLAYLDHAATGVLSRPVHAAAVDYLDGHAGRVAGRSPNNFAADLDRIERLRTRAAQLLNAPLTAVEVVPNTSAGVNWIAQGLDWAPGDRVVIPACEFPTNHLPWRALAARGVAVDRVPTPAGTFTPEALDAAITPRTRVVSVSWVQFLSGFRCDLAAVRDVCDARGVYLVVDAIQGVGALRFDAAEIRPDLVVAGGHKWLCAMHGLGVAAVSERLMERLVPVRGWLNGPVDWDDFSAITDDLHPDATRFRTGTLPTAQVYALDASIGAMLDAGPDALEAAVLDHARRLADGLDALGLRRYGVSDAAHASGIVTVEPDAPEALHAHLAAAGVHTALRSRKLRFSPHAHTRAADVERALDAVAAFVRPAVRPAVHA